MKNTILWDFDHTLARREGMWSGALAEATEVLFPEKATTREQIKSHLGKGFPWHSPQEPWLNEITPEKWWERLFRVFESALMELGYCAKESSQISRKSREIYLAKDSFELFEDTLEVLEELKVRGYSHAIVSNHVPELAAIVENLGIGEHFVRVFTSARIGYCKPHPKIYEKALEALNLKPENCWMIGDNEVADVQAPMELGISSILVRKDPVGVDTRYHFGDLRGVLKILD